MTTKETHVVKVPYPEITGTRRAAASEVMARRSGRLLNLYRMLLHSPPVARAWLELGSAIRFETTLPPRLRELAICRVAALMGSEYEWHHHAPIALEEGATEDELEALRGDGYGEVFDPATTAVLDHVSAVALGVEGDTAPSLVPEHGAQAVIELSALAAYYTAVSLFLNNLDVGVEAESDSDQAGTGDDDSQGGS